MAVRVLAVVFGIMVLMHGGRFDDEVEEPECDPDHPEKVISDEEHGDIVLDTDACKGDEGDGPLRMCYAWELVAPDHSPTGNKVFNFHLTINEMHITPGHAIDLPVSEEELDSGLIKSSSKCVDYVHIIHGEKLCGEVNSTNIETMTVENVWYVRLDACVETNAHESFNASYTWTKV